MSVSDPEQNFWDKENFFFSIKKSHICLLESLVKDIQAAGEASSPTENSSNLKVQNFFLFLDLKHCGVLFHILTIFAQIHAEIIFFIFTRFSVFVLLINSLFQLIFVSERREWRWETKMTFPLPTRNCWADSSSKIAYMHFCHDC